MLSGPLLTRRLRRTELFAVDAVFAVLLTLLCGYAATEAPLGADSGVSEPLWLSWLFGVAMGGPVAVRRRWPVAVCVAVFLVSVAALLFGVVPDYAGAAPSAALAFGLYTVGLLVPRRRSVLMLVACLVGIGVALAAAVFGPALTGPALDRGSAAPDSASANLGLAATGGEIGFACLMMAAAWLIGSTMRERRAYAARAAAQSAAEAASRAVHEERLRIARELHDVVAHSMSLIAVKAAVGNHVAEVSPEQAREALRVIEATSRGALQEMRQALGVLRTEGSSGASFAPRPGLDDLAELAERAAAGGVEVELDVRGRADLPEVVALSAFRIVQEALTNVVKHAAPARCRASIAVDGREVRIEVTDDGGGSVRPAGAPHREGHGLIGIRERVGMYGGVFAAGPGPEGGFTVTVRLPYGSAA